MENIKLGYISVSKLIDYANNHKNKKIDANDIARFPTEYVEPIVPGYWIVTGHYSITIDSAPIPVYACSVCGRLSEGTRHRYCHCGAKMILDEGDETDALAEMSQSLE